jgi:uncharacterized membrane protein
MAKESELNRDALPFVAPCRKLSPWAPLRWVRRGIGDLMEAPQQSMAYGLAVALMIGIVCLLAWFRGSQWFMFSMLGGFVFLAPLTCIGLYAISAQLERGQAPLMTRSMRAAFKRHFGNEMIFALALLVIFLVWARAAVMVSVFFPTDGNATLGEWIAYLGFGSAIGAVFAAVTFSASAFSLPMIMHRDVDSITAIVTSVNAVCLADHGRCVTADRGRNGIRRPDRYRAGNWVRRVAWIPRDNRRRSVSKARGRNNVCTAQWNADSGRGAR